MNRDHIASTQSQPLRNDRQGRRLVGCLLLTQLLFTVFVKFSGGQLQELLWLSHAALLTAAIGLLFSWPRLVDVALCWILIPHSAFLFDMGCRLTLDVHPIGVSEYLFQRDVWSWWATLHHFYLAPTLLFLSAANRQTSGLTLRLAGGVFAALLVASRFLTDYNTNANYSHFIPGEWEAVGLQHLNQVGHLAYLPILFTACVALLFAPSLALISAFAQSRWAASAASTTGKLATP